MKRIEYYSEEAAPTCSEKLVGCDLKSGTVHVCFEDGSGKTVCRNCFDSRLKTGDWISDDAKCIKAA